VVNRFQPATEDARLRLHRTSGGSAASLYQVQPDQEVSGAGGFGRLLITLITGYKRLISPWLPSACRFYPTCSDYMREAIEIHGPTQGVWLGLKRLSRCHPFHEGGFDAVPVSSKSE
jgi:putative membrane protein insertion efficiency factor